jgi:hypothetical protein
MSVFMQSKYSTVYTSYHLASIDLAIVTMGPGSRSESVRKCTARSDVRGTQGGFRVVARSARAERAALGREP